MSHFLKQNQYTRWPNAVSFENEKHLLLEKYKLIFLRNNKEL